MRVFIFEHICGGGLAGEELNSGLVREGGAMLGAVVEDFAALGVEVSTTLDERVSLALEGARVTLVKTGAEFEPIFDRCVRDADAALVIAPEFDKLLETWSARVASLGTRLLGCEPRGIAAVADKFALSGRLQRAGVPTPATSLGFDGNTTASPVVVKPRWGAGCERTFVCRSSEDFARLPKHDDWIRQPFAEGVAASAAFIVNGSNVRPLQAGSQLIEGKNQLSYHGGCLPLPPRLAERALQLGERAVRTIDGLRGYVGVDLVMGETAGQDRVIEINPRPTVAYVGLRKLCKNNLAAAILDPAAPLAWRPGSLSYDAAGQVTWEIPA